MKRTARGAVIAALDRLAGFMLGLQARVTILIVLLTLVVTGAACGLYVRLSQNATMRLQMDQASHTAFLIAKGSAALLESHQYQVLQKLADDSANGYPLIFVCFSDVARRRVAGAGTCDHLLEADQRVMVHEQRTGTVGTPIFVAGSNDRPPHLAVTYPIQGFGVAEDREPHLLGYVQVGFNLDRTLLQVSSALDLSSGIGLAALLLTIPLAFLLVRRIVVPLMEISETASRLASGDLSARSRVERSDEIGQLARSFNAMADKLAGSQQVIMSLNENLERRVRERTRQLSDLADRDPLTGLFNRRYFNESVRQRFAEAVRYSNDLACMMLDVDDFKTVNDLFGHFRGDELLQMLANIISSQLRASDLAARFGGDEFVILLPQTGSDQARGIAERVLARFYEESAASFPGIHGTVSIGIASLIGCCAETSDALIRAADRAMYEAKQRGKNRLALAGVLG